MTAVSQMSHSVAVGTEPCVQGQTFVVLSPTMAPGRSAPLAKWRKTAAKRLGLVLVVLGLAAVVCNVVWLSIPHTEYVTLSPSGLGFWGGVLLLVTGALCLSAGVRPSQGLVIGTLVMAIIALFACFSMLIISAVQVSLPRTPTYDSAFNSNLYYSNGTWVSSLVLPTPRDPSPLQTGQAFGIVFVLISVTSIALLITVAILSCKGLCSTRPSPGYVISTYHPNAFAYLPNPMAIHSTSSSPGQPVGLGAPPPYCASAYSDEPSAPQLYAAPPPSYSQVAGQEHSHKL